jgi:hypothetical protein
LKTAFFKVGLGNKAESSILAAHPFFNKTHSEISTNNMAATAEVVFFNRIEMRSVRFSRWFQTTGRS